MTKSNEWYTPPVIIDFVKEFYNGEIDLDPASSVEANALIQAKTIFTIDDDGLSKDWTLYKKIWCNPPYCNGAMQEWLKYAIEQYKLEPTIEIIMLVNRSDGKWYSKLIRNYVSGYFQLDFRVKFIDGLAGEPSSPRYTNDLIYFGQQPQAFFDLCLNHFDQPALSSFSPMIMQLNDIITGDETKKLDLSGANLSGANLSRANLSRANLSRANLSRANLSHADLSHADLYGTNLSGANLYRANLSHANLYGANLSGANLSGANLSGANLSGAIGNNYQIKTLQLAPYTITYTKDDMAIGCQQHSISDWFAFDDETIDRMDVGALDWWNQHKTIIKSIIESNV